jgi:hypothetical protein
MEREFSACCTAADLRFALRFWTFAPWFGLRVAFRPRLSVALRFAFDDAARLAARLGLPWTANER